MLMKVLRLRSLTEIYMLLNHSVFPQVGRNLGLVTMGTEATVAWCGLL